jgi:hypothetical protein
MCQLIVLNIYLISCDERYIRGFLLYLYILSEQHLSAYQADNFPNRYVCALILTDRYP